MKSAGVSETVMSPADDEGELTGLIVAAVLQGLFMALSFVSPLVSKHVSTTKER